MRIALITPAGRELKNGNRNTAMRWAHLLRELGHRVDVQVQWDGKAADLMLALHARRSHGSIAQFAARHPECPLVLALTGTDLYRDIQFDRDASASMQLATRMIVLQEMGLRELTPKLRAKTHVVYQSARPLARKAPLKNSFEVLVLGHLREEKDPLRAALALAHLPADSRVRVVHLGRALDPALAREAQALMQRDARYRWLGEQAHAQVRRYLARARLLVVSSRMEGGANVVSEALAANCPVIASRISGNIGMLGSRYAGYYTLEDERALAHLIHRAETDASLYARLSAQCRTRRKLTSVAAERAALARVIAAAQR